MKQKSFFITFKGFILVKSKIDRKFEYEHRWKVILSFVTELGFQDLTDSGMILRFCSI